MDSGQTPQTLQQAIEFFADPERCFQFMVRLRWPDGVTCPTCGQADPRFISTRRLFECKAKHPRRQFSVKVGTIFEDSPIALKKWLTAVWLIANCKNGISSYELGRAIGVTQKSAWFMNHRVRLAMQNQGGGLMGGSVEVDETFIGAKARNMHHDKREKTRKGTKTGMRKAAVLGLLERTTGDRKSRVRAFPVPTRKKHTLGRRVGEHVEKGATVYTDQLRSYDNLPYDGYVHKVINHAVSYAIGEVHTNGIENFWSLLKRSIRGTYVNVEPFHLFRYLDEQAFRFNEREGNDADRFVQTMGQVAGRRVMYKQLIAREHDL